MARLHARLQRQSDDVPDLLRERHDDASLRARRAEFDSSCHAIGIEPATVVADTVIADLNAGFVFRRIVLDPVRRTVAISCSG